MVKYEGRSQALRRDPDARMQGGDECGEVVIDGSSYGDYPTLRARLRAETAADHQAVEESSGPLDFSSDLQLPRFLVAQAAGFRALARVRVGAVLPEEGVLLTEINDTLALDCARLGLTVPALDWDEPIRSGAVAYLVMGSRLGTEMLRRRAEGAGLEPPAYFRLGVPKLQWRAFCERLEREDAYGSAADGLLASCRQGFALFRAANRLAGDRVLPETAGRQALAANRDNRPRTIRVAGGEHLGD